MSKKAIVTIRMEQEKWEDVKKVAKEKGMSASAFLRHCAYECAYKYLAKKA